jgi:hypothetical protein
MSCGSRRTGAGDAVMINPTEVDAAAAKRWAGWPTDVPTHIKLWALWALIGAALAARVLLVLISEGTNDIVYWKIFADSIRRVGILQTYQDVLLFNHPPLAGYWAATAGWLSAALGIPFSWVFKLAPFVADLATAWLLWRFARPRGPVFALGLAVAFLWSPIAILVSCFHANTDPILASLLLLAVLAADTKRPLTAGLALAAAANVKIVAIFAAPVILLRPATWRDRFRCSAMAALAIVPFLPTILGAGRAFFRNGVAYNSNPDEWGFLFVLRRLATVNRLGPIVLPLQGFFLKTGRWAIFAAAVAIAIAARAGRRSAAQATALVLTAFLVLAPGFGVQYTAWVLPILFAVGPLRVAVSYSLVGGAFLLLTYFHFWRGDFPVFSWFGDFYPLGAAIFGFWLWLILCGTFGRNLWCWVRGVGVRRHNSY